MAHEHLLYMCLNRENKKKMRRMCSKLQISVFITNVIQKIQDFVDYLGKMAASNNPGSTAQKAVADGLDAAFNQLTVVQEGAGSIAKQVDNSKNATTSIGTQLQATSSALLDTDLAAATAAYTRSQTILSAAQAMFARISQSNLFSKL